MTTVRTPERFNPHSASSALGRNSNSDQDLTWSGRRRCMTPSRSTKTVRLLKQCLPGGRGYGVLQDEVAILDHPVVAALDMDPEINQALEPAPVKADQTNRQGPQLSAHPHGLGDV